MEHATIPTIALDRMLDPLTDCLNAETAQRIIELRIAPDIQARIEWLAGRSSEGTITDEEREEYRSYVDSADLIAIFKAKARRVLGISRSGS